MALNYMGREMGTPTGANRLAEDADGNRVVVSGSEEAIEDHGWPAIWQAAEAKYARGDYDLNGTTRIIKVMTADCEEEGDDA